MQVLARPNKQHPNHTPAPRPRRRTPTWGLQSPGALPTWVWVPAALGAGLILLPLAGLLTRVQWGQLGELLTSPASVAALRLSLVTALAATVLSVLCGIPLALILARLDFPGRSALRTGVLLPLVLPPVVGGVALLYTFGRMGFVGRYLEAGGISIAFTTGAVVLAQTFVALPFVVITLEGALAALDPGLEKVALGLGASPTRTLFTVTLPVLRPALLSASVLAFARSLGEFGATVTFAGSLQGRTRTLPLEIYLQNESGDPASAVALSLVLVIIAFAIVLLSYRPAHRRRGALD